MVKYVFKEIAPILSGKKADPQKVGEALAKLTVDGKLEPKTIWQTAKASSKHPLHRFYDWDVQRSAEAHWTEQSRQLIRSIRVEDEEAEEGHTPAFVSIADKSGVSYRPVQDVKDSPKLQAVVLAQAERDLEAFEKRYRSLVDICKKVREARSLVRRKLDESRSAA